MEVIDCFDVEIKKRVSVVNDYIRTYFSSLEIPASSAIAELSSSMYYSASAGGKRFRPVLCLLVGDLFHCEAKKILPFATAVELVHTYSLVHDDLPCMDNDDIRRGKPTNHVMYSETTALLAGDALLTEAFLLIAEGYKENSTLAATLCGMLSRAAGLRGMVGGQAIDLKAKNLSFEELIQLHNLKTGRLIQVAIEGAAVVAGASRDKVNDMVEFGTNLGLAFQVADDILDHAEKNQESKSFVSLIGIEGTKRYLDEVSAKAFAALERTEGSSDLLKQMIEYNKNRKI